MLMQARFEAKFERVPFAGCWLWTAGIFEKRGYGAFAHPEQLAHRVAWAMYRGPIPAGMCVLHRCDVPACVNPDHLFLGTQTDNMSDKVQKRRQSMGAGTGRAEITESQVKEILADLRLHREIAAQYGVTQSTISNIKLRKTWKHVDGSADRRYQRTPASREAQP